MSSFDKVYQKQLASILNDYLSDALNDDNYTPDELAAAIRDSISEWVEYHRVQMEKAQKVVELLQVDKPKPKPDNQKVWNYFEDRWGDHIKAPDSDPGYVSGFGINDVHDPIVTFSDNSYMDALNWKPDDDTIKSDVKFKFDNYYDK